MGQYVIRNGELLRKENASLPLDNRGTLYGDGLFETMRCKGVIIPFYDLHWERLTAGLTMLKMDYETSFNKETLWNAIQRILHKEKMYVGASVRVNCIRKIGGKYTPTNNGVDYFIEAFVLKEDEYILNQPGLKLGLYTEVPKPISPISQFKNSNAIPMILAGIYAQSIQVDECLLLNSRGYITESISSNVFFKMGNDMLTPSLETGCVNGTMRKIMMDLIPKAGFNLLESDCLTPDLLNASDEVFITNAVAGIKWVVAYERKRYFYKTSQALLHQLNTHFHQMHTRYSIR